MLHFCILALMICQTDDLFRRNKMEFLVLGVPSSSTDYGYPYVHSTSGRVDQYFKRRTNITVMEFVGGLEAFCKAGLDGEFAKVLVLSLADPSPHSSAVLQSVTDEVGDMRGVRGHGCRSTDRRACGHRSHPRGLALLLFSTRLLRLPENHIL